MGDQRAKGFRPPGALGDTHPVGEVVGHREGDIGDVESSMAPSPRGTHREEQERSFAQSWMERC